MKYLIVITFLISTICHTGNHKNHDHDHKDKIVIIIKKILI